MIRRRIATALCLALAALPGLAQATGTDPEFREVLVAQLSPEEVKQSVQAATASIQQARPGRIWCVPFARAVSGINIRGDAATWWKTAANQYPRGQVPVAGSVLNFRATGKMPRGHVAVVSQVISPRQILVDQANWVTNRITTDMVIDVSEANDWSAVRVENQAKSFGSVYPTYGFIYRPYAGNVAG